MLTLRLLHGRAGAWTLSRWCQETGQKQDDGTGPLCRGEGPSPGSLTPTRCHTSPGGHGALPAQTNPSRLRLRGQRCPALGRAQPVSDQTFSQNMAQRQGQECPGAKTQGRRRRQQLVGSLRYLVCRRGGWLSRRPDAWTRRVCICCPHQALVSFQASAVLLWVTPWTQ